MKVELQGLAKFCIRRDLSEGDRAKVEEVVFQPSSWQITASTPSASLTYNIPGYAHNSCNLNSHLLTLGRKAPPAPRNKKPPSQKTSTLSFKPVFRRILSPDLKRRLREMTAVVEAQTAVISPSNGNGNGTGNAATAIAGTNGGTGNKLHGYAFYESIGRPKFVIAPMVDQSELVSIISLSGWAFYLNDRRG